MMMMMMTDFILEKRVSLILGIFLLMALINAYKILSKKVYSYNVGHSIHDTEEAEELTFDKLEPRFRSEVIERYPAFLAVSKAMKKDNSREISYLIFLEN